MAEPAVPPVTAKPKMGRPRIYATLADRIAAGAVRRKVLEAARRLGEEPVLQCKPHDSRQRAHIPTPGTPGAKAERAAADRPVETPLPLVIREAMSKAVEHLSVPDAIFVKGVCSGLTPAEAFRQARPRLNPSSAGSMASARLKNHPEIQKAVEDVKAALAIEIAYDFKAFTEELDKAAEFARRTANATALVRAIELKGKATGHLADKPLNAAGAGFHLTIAGVESPPILTLERVND